MNHAPFRTGIVSRGDIFPPNHGAAVKLVRTAEALAARGNHVVLVPGRGPVYHRFTPAGRVEIPLPSGLGRIPGASSTARNWLRRAGVPADDMVLYEPLLDPHFFAAVAFVARQERLQILQAEFPGFALACLAARLAHRHRVIVVEHNVEYLRMQQTADMTPADVRHMKALESALLRAASGVVAVSEPDRERIAALGVPRRHIHLIPHGVDLAAYAHPDLEAARRHANLPPGRPVIVFHGVLHYPPNARAVHVLAHEILPRLHAKGVPAVALIVGMNPPREALTPACVATGAVEHPAPYLKLAHAAAIPLEGGGGTRMKILECFAAGLPVVSTAIGAEGIPARDGAEIIIREGWDAFADALAQVLTDAAWARSIGEAGKRFVAAYDWSAIAARYEAVYRDVL